MAYLRPYVILGGGSFVYDLLADVGGVESGLDINESFKYDAKRFHDDVYDDGGTLQKPCTTPPLFRIGDMHETRLQSYRLSSTK